MACENGAAQRCAAAGHDAGRKAVILTPFTHASPRGGTSSSVATTLSAHEKGVWLAPARKHADLRAADGASSCLLAGRRGWSAGTLAPLMPASVYLAVENPSPSITIHAVQPCAPNWLQPCAHSRMVNFERVVVVYCVSSHESPVASSFFSWHLPAPAARSASPSSASAGAKRLTPAKTDEQLVMPTRCCLSTMPTPQKAALGLAPDGSSSGRGRAI